MTPGFLTPAEAGAIERRAAAVEQRTGVQIVAAVVGKSDAYVELPWKAFALGAALASLGCVVSVPAVRALSVVLLVLGVGAASALAAVILPAYARLYLTGTRRDLEVRLNAQALFLRHRLFATRARNGVLVLVSRFERRVEILADVGLDGRVGRGDWEGVIARMRPLLAAASFANALLEGLGASEELLAAHGFVGPPAAGNELPDRPLDERGNE